MGLLGVLGLSLAFCLISLAWSHQGRLLWSPWQHPNAGAGTNWDKCKNRTVHAAHGQCIPLVFFDGCCCTPMYPKSS
ncbi:hypothetical protein PGT21_036423 [Puccinia graminis f. sp. tritici]|uniref:Secreted protein n=1 Tax=Puccinia graminis f. sp. tritici TaxID=56615 RepID=A0A5B0Q068_PUCGR|nr:hypothetical protein PGT21_036423 [Puccinia graminis f. sp. tritici]KAA1126212.1 hypothetical protein PGTUg99_014478 [Puccinia graminis f. sp. tritici]